MIYSTVRKIVLNTRLIFGSKNLFVNEMNPKVNQVWWLNLIQLFGHNQQK